MKPAGASADFALRGNTQWKHNGNNLVLPLPFCAPLNLSRCCPFIAASFFFFFLQSSIVSLQSASSSSATSERDPKADEMTAATLPESGRPSGFITRIPPSVEYANKVWDGGFQMG